LVGEFRRGEHLLVNHFLLAAMGLQDMWYAVPLVIVVSLVYAATRFEPTGLILQHAVRTVGWIFAFMAAAFAVVLLVNWWL
jgi:hypothetical protein